jgi:hypothetical protein
MCGDFKSSCGDLPNLFALKDSYPSSEKVFDSKLYPKLGSVCIIRELFGEGSGKKEKGLQTTLNFFALSLVKLRNFAIIKRNLSAA